MQVCQRLRVPFSSAFFAQIPKQIVLHSLYHGLAELNVFTLENISFPIDLLFPGVMRHS